MHMKKFLILLSLMMLPLTGACTPSLDRDDDDTTVVEEEHPWATWETCAQNIGDHPCDFTLVDQYSNEVSLYDYYGSVIVLDLSTMWCGPCQMAAAEVQQVQDNYANEIVYLTVLIENLDREDPVHVDLVQWADIFGISAPVLGGSRDLIDATGVSGWPLTSWPTFFFITDEMVIHTALRGFSSAYVDMLIEETIGEGQE